MITMKMSEGGRVVVPAEIRRAMQINDGDTVLWELVDGSARLTTRLAQIKAAQALFQQFCPPDGRSMVDELIAERRAEAAKEDVL